MGVKRFSALLTILAPLTASAQQQQAAPADNVAVENVIVTEPRLRSEHALNSFVIAHAAPTALLGKIARWKKGICPLTVGLSPRLNLYISQRILLARLSNTLVLCWKKLS